MSRMRAIPDAALPCLPLAMLAEAKHTPGNVDP